MSGEFMARESFDVCVVGGGPAGTLTALKVARFGHRVCLVERCPFPRPHVGESLTSGIWPILDVLGLRQNILQQGFLDPGETLLRWAAVRTERVPASNRGNGLLVERGKFDLVLLQAARDSGVRIFQPGEIRSTNGKGFKWELGVIARGEPRAIDAAFLVDASGRGGFLPGKQTRVSPPTVALCGYLRGAACPQETLVEALPDGWCWGAPIPGGLFSAMVFSDPAALRPFRGAGLEAIWRSQLAKAELFATIAQVPHVGCVVARNATAYCSIDAIGPSFVRVGEASFSLDPLSSTGVEKAMRSGLTAAIALHTMMVRPERRELSVRFYRDRIAEAVAAHARWSVGFYQDVGRYADFPFWEARSEGVEQPRSEVSRANVSAPDGIGLTTHVRISQRAQWIEEACIVGDEICAHPALVHPNLERPVAFLEGVALRSMLEAVATMPDLGRLVTFWSRRVSLPQAKRIAAWLMKHEILEAVP
jgi:flavin-dependent dehydrogenase